MNTEMFDIRKASDLQASYKKRRELNKKKLVNELLIYQRIWGSKSIVGAKISIPGYYRKTTIIDVLDCLGYKLDYHKTYTRKGLFGETYGKDTYIIFSVDEAL